jgi:cytochrome P450
MTLSRKGREIHGCQMARSKLKHIVVTDFQHIAGDKWHSHRKILTATFHFKILEEYIQVFNSYSQALVQKLEELIGQPFVDVTPYITMCTLDIICGKTFINYLLRSYSYFIIKETPQKTSIL